MSGPLSPIKDPDILKHLKLSWENYKKNMIENGRPLADPDEADLDFDKNTTERLTYSESVAYVLMRAVTMADQTDKKAFAENKKTFEEVWNWARQNLQRKNIKDWWTCPEANIKVVNEKRFCLQWVPEKMPEQYRDNLFAWRYMPSVNKGGPGGILSYNVIGKEIDRSGYNAASDDIEIAAALYFAYLRGWGLDYLRSAQDILDDAWKKYVVKVEGQNYFFAGDQFAAAGEINPSYFRPAYFNYIFPAIENLKDPEQARTPWHELSTTSYEIIYASGNADLFLNSRSGVGINLPSDWLAMNYDGELKESNFFPGAAGANFGWDAFRTLYGVAQDYAWFGGNAAHEYLFNCEIGPACFLKEQIRFSGKINAGYRHDGSPVPGNIGAKQGRALNQEQLAFYGGYLPFFYAGDMPGHTQRIINHLKKSFQPAGYWGDDPKNYFTQNWVWFGLLLAYNNGLPIGLETTIQNLPPPPNVDGAKAAARTWGTPSLFQIDYELGLQTSDRRPLLNSKHLNKKVSLKQMADTLQSIIDRPYQPLGQQAENFKQFGEIYRLDQKYNFKLLAFFSDPREYWNNAISLLSVYAQKATEEDYKEEFQKIINFCTEFRKRIAAQEAALPETLRRSYTPHTYQRVVLDLTEAEIRSQMKGRDLNFYQQGVNQASAAINAMLTINPREARPDYHLIAKTLLTIGDLYLRMFDVTRNSSYEKKAAKFFDQVEQLDKGQVAPAPEPGLGTYLSQPVHLSDLELFVKGLDRTIIEAKDEGFVVDLSPQVVAEALNFNYRKGYLSADAMIDAQQATPYLKGIAMVKNIAIFIQQPGQKDPAKINDQIAKCDKAIMIINAANEGKTEPDFFAYFAKNVKADLLLALADQLRFKAKPGQEPAAALNYIRQAEALYAETPSKFKFLYAWSQTKITEIAVRTADFIMREFKYLFPFYTRPLSGKNPIPNNEFLGVELDYMQSLLFVSTKRVPDMAKAAILLSGQIPKYLVLSEIPAIKDKLHLFFVNPNAANLVFKQFSPELVSTQINNPVQRRTFLDLLNIWKRSPAGVVNNAKQLPDPLYQKYFEAQAKLKLLEIAIRSERHLSQDKTEFVAMEKSFSALEAMINSFTVQELTDMNWNTHSFLAELYHEWANVLRSRKNFTKAEAFAEKSAVHCCQSDSPFDRGRRLEELRHDFMYISSKCK